MKINTVFFLIIIFLLGSAISCNNNDDDDNDENTEADDDSDDDQDDDSDDDTSDDLDDDSDDDDSYDDDDTENSYDSIIGVATNGDIVWSYWLKQTSHQIGHADFNNNNIIAFTAIIEEDNRQIGFVSISGELLNEYTFEDSLNNIIYYNQDEFIAFGGDYSHQSEVVSLITSDDGVIWRANDDQQFVIGSAIDKNNNIIVTGNASQNENFEQCFLQKYDSQGSLLDEWTFRTNIEYNLYTEVVIDNYNDYFVMCESIFKFDSGGNLVWESTEDRFGGIETDGENIYAVSSDFDEPAIYKYSSDGTILWNDTLDYPFPDAPFFIEVRFDSQKQPIVCGHGFHFDVPDDVICRKYSTDGILLWSSTYYNTPDLNSYLIDMEIDINNNIYLGIDRGFGDCDYDIVKLDSDGNEVWKVAQEGEFSDEQPNSPDEPMLFSAGGHLMLAPEWQIHYDDDDDTVE